MLGCIWFKIKSINLYENEFSFGNDEFVFIFIRYINSELVVSLRVEQPGNVRILKLVLKIKILNIYFITLVFGEFHISTSGLLSHFSGNINIQGI